MTSRSFALPLFFATAFAQAQMPDFSIMADIRAGVHFSEHDSRPRMFDPFGRISTVNLSLIFEGFYRVSLSERFSKIPGDTMSNHVEHFYVELPGVWRVGILDTKFGRGWLIREYGLGGEFTTHLLFDNLPITIAAVDDGGRRTRAIMARIGSKAGISFATGNYLAASGTSLTAIRRPEQAPGIGRGYRMLMGADAAATWREFKGKVEYVGLREGVTALDPQEDIVDLELSYQAHPLATEYKLGYARTLQGRSDHLRAEVEIPVDEKLSLTAQFRMDQGRRLLAFGVHIRF